MGVLDGVELFTVSVETGSFAAAARRLGVTPSAVSRWVAALEAELGVTWQPPLVDRLALGSTTRRLDLE